MRVPDLRSVASSYDRIYQTSPLADSDRFYCWVLDQAQVSAGARVLDIGCGLGGALRAISARGAEAWGVDISPEALRGAGIQAPRSRRIRADGACLPFPDGAFSTLLNLGNLEHFTNLDGGILEMRRVLSDSGEAWILLPNLFYSGTLWRVIRDGYGPDHHQPIDRFATRNEWRDLLTAGGLQVVSCVPYHKGKWWKRLLPANLAWHFLFQVRKGPLEGKPALQPLGRIRES